MLQPYTNYSAALINSVIKCTATIFLKVLDQYRRQYCCSKKRTHLWSSKRAQSPSLSLLQYNQRCRRHKFIARLIDSPRGDHCQILHPFALCVVRLCFLSEWQEEVVFFGIECLLLFQPSRLLPTVCCATAGCGRGLNGEYERTTWFDFSYFCSRVVFSALSNMKPNLPVPSDSPVKNSPHCCNIYSPQMLHYKLGEAVYLKEWYYSYILQHVR